MEQDRVGRAEVIKESVSSRGGGPASLYYARARRNQVVNQLSRGVGQRAPPAQFGTHAPY